MNEVRGMAETVSEDVIDSDAPTLTLSIIIVCLNEEKHLPRCLQAIHEIDHADLQLDIIVVDGGSRDRSRQIAQLFGRVVESPRVMQRQRNAGASVARGALLAYVDADVQLLAGWFGTVARHFASNRYKLLGSAPRLPTDASWIARAYALHWGLPPDTRTPQVSHDSRLLSTQSLVMGREVFEQVNGFGEELGVDEDTIFVLQAKQQGVSVVCDTGLSYIHHGEPRTLGAFFNRIRWGANYANWFGCIRRGELAFAWRPQYLYGGCCGCQRDRALHFDAPRLDAPRRTAAERVHRSSCIARAAHGHDCASGSSCCSSPPGLSHIGATLLDVWHLRLGQCYRNGWLWLEQNQTLALD